MTSSLKRRAQQQIQTLQQDLVSLSQQLHAEPELGWAEYKSSQRVAEALASAGFDVTQPYLALDTAFHAKAGAASPKLCIGLMAEYDALPGLGHACGHNLIAASSVGAAIGLAQVAAELDIGVEVFGTPAEEGGGGKIELLERGAFEGLDLAMMVHPGPVDVARASPLAVAHWSVQFTGKAAHAAAFPTEGLNAADAFTIAQVSIGLLRQHLPATARVHGVVLEAGTAPNSIPAFARGRWYVRAETTDELRQIEQRVMACFEAAALATGCTFEWELESQPYAEFHHDEQALKFYAQNAEALGRTFQPHAPGAEMASASTDMGNVSHHVPAIHPYIGLDSFPVLNHQREFADHTIGPIAEQALLDGAVGLAWTAIDVALAHDE